MEILIVKNFSSLNQLQKTKLTSAVSEGGTTLAVENESGFDTDHKVLIAPSSEFAEIRTVNAVSDESIDLTGDALDHAHDEDTEVIKLRGDKIRIYRAANVDGSVPAAGSFSLLTTVTIVADQVETEYIDSSGGSGYWYVSTIYNSVDDTETDIDVDNARRGGGYGYYATIDQIRKTAGFEGADFISDNDIAEAREDANSIIKGRIRKRYTLPLSTVPKMLIRIERLIAAGLILTDEYSIDSGGTENEGNAKYKKGMSLLNELVTGETELVSADEGLEEETSTIEAFPTSELATEYGDRRVFRISDEY